MLQAHLRAHQVRACRDRNEKFEFVKIYGRCHVALIVSAASISWNSMSFEPGRPARSRQDPRTDGANGDVKHMMTSRPRLKADLRLRLKLLTTEKCIPWHGPKSAICNRQKGVMEMIADEELIKHTCPSGQESYDIRQMIPWKLW
jgi:hypothetical protein